MEYKRGILFLRLDGSLDKYTSFILDDALKNVIIKGGIKYLLINFERLSCIDNNGIYSIVNWYKDYIKDNGKLMICGYNNFTRLQIESSDIVRYASYLENEICAFDEVNI